MINKCSIEQLMLLNSLMYYKISFYKDMKLKDVLDMFLKDHPNTKGVEKGTMINHEKAVQVLEAIYNDPLLCNLEIIKSSLGVEDRKGPKQVCFIDTERKEAIFTYCGTNAKEWLDNAEGFVKESSTLQKNALSFFEETLVENHLKEEGYHITVTGHSKGGNKAQFVAIKNPNVDRCVSFDGQGFSKEFILANTKEIQERSVKIETHAAHRDYVSPLGIDIAARHTYYKTQESQEVPGETFVQNMKEVKDGAFAHSLASCFHFESEQITLNEVCNRSYKSTQLSEMCDEMMESPVKEKERYFKGLMGSIQLVCNRNPIREDEKPKVGEILSGAAGAIKFMKDHGADKGILYFLMKDNEEFSSKIPTKTKEKLEARLEELEKPVELPEKSIDKTLYNEDAAENDLLNQGRSDDMSMEGWKEKIALLKVQTSVHIDKETKGKTTSRER